MDKIMHYGTPRHSGRYPWGSGKNPQRNKSLNTIANELKKSGLKEKEIAEGFGMNTTQLRQTKSVLKAEKIQADIAQARRLKDKGYSNTKIGEIMGRGESSVRMLLKPGIKERADSIKATVNILKENIEKKQYIDIGPGIEHQLGISRTKLRTVVSELEKEGYTIHFIKTPQLGTQFNTSIKVIAKPGVEYKEVSANRHKIGMITDYSEDGGRSFLGLEKPRSINSNRIKVRYDEEGGSDKDGIIELRRGVPELSLGTKRYAQVRIAVDGTHYLKGIAMYSDDLPDGIDIVYNSNKSKQISKQDVFKKMKDDPDNPFGSSVRQKHYIDKDGNKQLSALQIVGLKEGSGEEGGWEVWSRNLSSQFLSKQSPALAKRQLGLAYDLRKEEYDEIMSLNNPAVRKKLLKSFSDACDADAEHLKAAALPRQQTQLIIPLPKIKENQIYAPNFREGETVVLIRHPHGGQFEIPELKVTKKDPSGKKIIGNSIDAVGIHPKVAAKLSGADFDGDTVIVIPNNNKLIRTNNDPVYKSLLDFNPRAIYRIPEGSKIKKMDEATKGLKMGDVSNLITDMTIKGAHPSEIVRAVKHSMVVIDAVNHNLDYKRSFNDFGIAALKKTYQGSSTGGASTLISKAKSPKAVPFREEGKYVTNPKTGAVKKLYIDPVTGKKLYNEIGGTYTTKQGKVIKRTILSTKMREEDDALKLSSGTRIEEVYGNHANRLKALANRARLDYLAAPRLVSSPSAKQTYAPQVASLNAKLKFAESNKPFERKAQLIGNAVVNMKKQANPDLKGKELKKIKDQALTEARLRVSTTKDPLIGRRITVTPKEWEAMQAGAISDTKLTKIINNMQEEQLKSLAMPRNVSTLSPAKLASAKAKLDLGYTRAEVADSLGISVSTLSNALKSS